MLKRVRKSSRSFSILQAIIIIGIGALALFVLYSTLNSNRPNNKNVEAATPAGITAWAVRSTRALQNRRTDGSTIEATRSNPTFATGPADFEPNESLVNTFFSLGKGGVVEYVFDRDVENIPGANDISIHEATATNRFTYPEEKAKIEISQDGYTWKWVGASSSRHNDAGEGVDLINIDSSGYSWFKYIRITDITNFTGAPALLDGFDLDAIGVAKLTSINTAQLPTRTVCSNSPINNGSDPQYIYLNIASFNIGGGMHLNNSATINGLADWLKNNKIDIAGFQEVAKSSDGRFQVNLEIVKLLQQKGYPMNTNIDRDGGVAFFSRFPLTALTDLTMQGGRSPEGGNYSARRAITMQTQTPAGNVRLFNHHQHISSGCYQLYPYFYDLIAKYNDKNMIVFGDLNSNVGQKYLDPLSGSECRGGTVNGVSYGPINNGYMKYVCMSGKRCDYNRRMIDTIFVPKMPANTNVKTELYEMCVIGYGTDIKLSDAHYPKAATIKIAR